MMKSKYLNSGAFILCASIAALAQTQAARACSPPLPASSQASDIARVMNAPEFRAELNKQTSADPWVEITGVATGQGVSVSLSNGCVISNVLRFAPPESLGLCPKFIGVLSATFCDE
jgi:hypothetical protein